MVHRSVDANLDSEGLVREISAIIQLEQGAENIVRINLGGAGKVAASAATLAASVHLHLLTGSLYYSEAENYSEPGRERQAHGLALGMKGEPFDLPFFRLDIPRDDARLTLGLLAGVPRHELRYGVVIATLRKCGFKEYIVPEEEDPKRGRARNRANVMLNKRVVGKLRRQGFVEVEPLGRERILRLTRPGRYMANLCVPPLLSPTDPAVFPKPIE
ncbi:MAG: hypothetical protein KGJ23_11275 [Euryarchaeota archaeon]|nr:hypothetical protein [Euryarchaeota archaeon]MDE1837175.1 hypothetical protein [Euryarchaeota archaeon]MDE1881099.1 hypothetical protein [Euryarchaeota archaeon]MDE2045331.1 hypothetical protein [Thermoplasmata archaeon]